MQSVRKEKLRLQLKAFKDVSSQPHERFYLKMVFKTNKEGFKIFNYLYNTKE